MENLVIEHKDALKGGIGYLAVTVVLAVILIIPGERFVFSVGTALLIAALAVELYMTVSTLIFTFSQEILSQEGITVRNVFGEKTYLWKDLSRFEIYWDYKGRRTLKKEAEDAPYIILKFENPKKKIRFDYLEAIDLHIRECYGQPHVDNWTNVGK